MNFNISIHAPARGATKSRIRLHASYRFQSTLPRGERLEFGAVLQTIETFQSTLPRGERHTGDLAEIIPPKISIHAPARGATQNKLPYLFANRNFNPRSREGSDIVRDAVWYFTLQFQSTLPRGERRGTTSTPTGSTTFQSTLPRGERLIVIPSHGQLYPFQSTLPRGERLGWQTSQILYDTFQSTLPRGERLYGTAPVQGTELISIHAPARGATKDAVLINNNTLHFNPRSREGSDCLCC